MRILNISALLFLSAFSVYILIIGKNIIFPIIISALIWYLINVFADLYSKIYFRGKNLPKWVCFALSILTISLALWLLFSVISSNVEKVAQKAGFYQERTIRLSGRIIDYLGLTKTPSVSDIKQSVDFKRAILSIAQTITALAGNIGVIFVYVLFMLLEQKSFNTKLYELLKGTGKEQLVRQIIGEIDRDIKAYINIKALISLLSSLLGWGIMFFIGIDFAVFWAMIIFIFNFIPIIGPIIATIFPALLALIQFDSLYPFLIMISGISFIQVFIGNILETKLMGNSLNMSPIAILISLAVWQQVWGIAGMFLGMPMMVILIIIFSNIPKTRFIAVLLSKDGRLK